MNSPNNTNIGRRLDNVPVGRFHRKFMLLVFLGMFLDSFDNNVASSVLATTLNNEFSTLEQNSIFLTATFLGLAIGSAFAGWLSDRFGRVFAFQFNLLLFGTMALLAALAPSMEVLIVLRFLMSLGMGAEYVICYGMITEFIPRGRRGRFLGLLGIFGGLGLAVAPLLGWLLIPLAGWRVLFLLGGAGALIVWYLRRGMPESPRWLESRGRHSEAEAVIQRILRENRTPETPGQTLTIDNASADAPSSDSETENESNDWVPATVLFTKPVIARTLLALLFSAAALFCSNAISNWLPTFFVEAGMDIDASLGLNAAIMSGAILGPLLCVFVVDKLGRRYSLLFIGGIGTLCAATFPFMTQPALIATVGIVLTATANAFLTVCLGTVPEFFPTAFRFRGGGFTQTAARFTLIFSPAIILWLFEGFGLFGPILTVSGLFFTVSLVFFISRIDLSGQGLRNLSPKANID